MLGRSFATGEDEPGRDQVVMLSYGLWQRRFGADRGVLGTDIRVDGRPHTIAGVMGKEFNFPVPTDVWIPLALTPEQSAERAARTLRVFGPLKAGVSFAQAQAEMTAIADRLASAYPATNKDRRAHVLPVREYVQGTITRAYTFMLLAVVGIVLLVACANVAGLQFARATARRTELALRAALGASRLRIVRQWITESILLSILGGAAGLLSAVALLRLCLENMPPYVARLIPGWDRIRLDPRALSFTLAAALLSGVLAGLLPAFSASRTPTKL